MARSLSGGMAASVAAESGRMVIRLLELVHSGGTVRWTNAANDVDWNGQTWTAIGGALSIGGASEGGKDAKGEGLPVQLSGVDGTIVSIIMDNHFRGHEVTVWRVHLNDGAVVADPIEEFRGFQNAPYTITDESPDFDGSSGSVRINTRWVSRLTLLDRPNSVRTNAQSHRDMLRRAGLTGTALDDAIMTHLPGSIAALQNLRWGSDTPAPLGPGYGGGAGRDDDRDLL